MNYALNYFLTHHIARCLFASLKIMVTAKRFGASEEVVNETNVYFVTKDKSFYKKGIEMLKKCSNDSIALNADYYFMLSLNAY